MTLQVKEMEGKEKSSKAGAWGTSLLVQGLRLCASTAGGEGLIPGLGTKFLHALWHSHKERWEGS